MKKPGIIFALLLSSLFSIAQVQRIPLKSADSAANKSAVNTMDKAGKKDLMKDLGLTKEQRSKLKEIRQSNKAKKESAENNDQLSDQ